MSFLTRLANGLGTVLGVLQDTARTVIEQIRQGYEDFQKRGGLTQTQAVDDAQKKRQRLRDINDEIMDLRNRRMSLGTLSDRERTQWELLRDERAELMDALGLAKEVKAAEKIFASEELIQKIEIDLDTTHVFQYNAFADTLGKKCPKCRRQMKLQWQRGLRVLGPRDFFWGCSGWYVQVGGKTACSHKERLQPDDYGLMTDVSAPEFQLTATQFDQIITNPSTEKIISTRLKDLQSDLNASGHGVELATCPVHGEHMVLRQSKTPGGLLNTFFLACPYWQPNNQGCSFMEKLKSGSQLAALLKSQTGTGIL